MIEILDHLPTQASERLYLTRIAAALSRSLPSNWSLVLTSNGRNLPKTKHRKIVFLTSDESHSTPRYASDPTVALIFKQYAPYGPELPKVKPLPLGYAGMFPRRMAPPLKDRKYTASFAGHAHPRRKYFKQATIHLTKSQYHPSFIQWNNTFRSGMPTPVYADMLYDTKIALCPEGQCSTETFRFFEAMLSGCVILTIPQPDNWIYRDAPHITVSNWSQLPSIVDALLCDPEKMQALSEAAIRWWNSKCSEQAVAQYVGQCLHRSKGRVA